MDKNINIQYEVEKTLNSLDSFPKQKARPFMQTRILSKLENETAGFSVFNKLFDIPVLKPAFASIIILINVLTIFQVIQNNNLPSSTDLSTVEIFTDEYLFNESSELLFYTDIE